MFKQNISSKEENERIKETLSIQSTFEDLTLSELHEILKKIDSNEIENVLFSESIKTKIDTTQIRKELYAELLSFQLILADLFFD